MKNMKTLESNFRIMIIIKTLEYHKIINKNHENHKISCENNENDKTIIQFHIRKIKNLEKLIIPRGNYENHENHKNS